MSCKIKINKIKIKRCQAERNKEKRNTSTTQSPLWAYRKDKKNFFFCLALFFQKFLEAFRQANKKTRNGRGDRPENEKCHVKLKGVRQICQAGNKKRSGVKMCQAKIIENNRK